MGIQAQGSSGCLKDGVAFDLFGHGFNQVLDVISRLGLVVMEERFDVHVTFVPDR